MSIKGDVHTSTMQTPTKVKYLANKTPPPGPIKENGLPDMRFGANQEWFKRVHSQEVNSPVYQRIVKDELTFDKICDYLRSIGFTFTVSDNHVIDVKKFKILPGLALSQLRRSTFIRLRHQDPYKGKEMRQFVTEDGEGKDSSGIVYIYFDLKYYGGEVKMGKACEKQRNKRAESQVGNYSDPVIIKFSTPFHSTVEARVHEIFDDVRLPKIEKDGGTEWFHMTVAKAIVAVATAVEASTGFESPWDKEMSDPAFRAKIEKLHQTSPDAKMNSMAGKVKQAQFDALSRFQDQLLPRSPRAPRSPNAIQLFPNLVREEQSVVKLLPSIPEDFPSPSPAKHMACLGITKAGSPCLFSCNGKKARNGFCGKHKHQDPAYK